VSDTDQPRSTRSPWRILGVGSGVLLIVAVLSLLVLGFVKDSDPLELDRRFSAGERPVVPDFTLPIFANGGRLGGEGDPVTLSKLVGQPVIVNFWADWCDPCHAEAPILERLHRRYGDRVVFLTVNSEDEPDNARAFLRKYGAKFPVVRTGSGKVRSSFGTEQMPETFVLDSDGRLGMKPFRGQLTESQAAGIGRYLDERLAP
jgi:cytochrome c biogenesis protein CcmG/thiol:disulfide interchange protein DsbE